MCHLYFDNISNFVVLSAEELDRVSGGCSDHISRDAMLESNRTAGHCATPAPIRKKAGSIRDFPAKNYTDPDGSVMALAMGFSMK